MNQSSFEERFDFASSLIREAGELALSYFQRFDTLVVKSKGQQDMASEADLNAELLIRNRIASRFPEDAFLGEETGHTEFTSGQGIWVVDPIDGTQPFISGLSGWCVSIAFVLDGRLEIGLVYSPVRGELFAGGSYKESTLNGQPIRVSTAARLADGIVGVGYSPRVRPDEFLPVFSRLLHAGAMFHREGSGALTLCYVGCGRLIGYIEPHINSWDCLGALAIVQAAGGTINNFLADDGLWKGNRVIAGPATLYPALEGLFEEEATRFLETR
jgi:Archaeal fructose-1,6-bisphosphatase and related enzymes of inositol monophosphatase family